MNNTAIKAGRPLDLARLNKNEYRDVIIDWVNGYEVKYHLTMTFREGVPQCRTRRQLNYFMHILNSKIYRRKYHKGSSCIRGFAVRETSDEWDGDHYHIMIINDEGIPEFDDMKKLVEKKAEMCKRSNKWDSVHNVFLQEYYNNDGTKGLETYLTKNSLIHSNSNQKVFDSIGLLGNPGVCFGRLKFDDINDGVEDFIERNRER
jgi:hypothetical protein